MKKAQNIKHLPPSKAGSRRPFTRKQNPDQGGTTKHKSRKQKETAHGWQTVQKQKTAAQGWNTVHKTQGAKHNKRSHRKVREVDRAPCGSDEEESREADRARCRGRNRQDAARGSRSGGVDDTWVGPSDAGSGHGSSCSWLGLSDAGSGQALGTLRLRLDGPPWQFELSGAHWIFRILRILRRHSRAHSHLLQ